MIRTSYVFPLVACAVLLTATAIHAASSPEQTCQKGRYSAAAQYSACQQKALASFLAGGDLNKFLAAGGKCQTKYAAVWPKLAAKAAGTGSTCDTVRYTDNGTTVTDNLTALQWEKKTDDATIHDKDNPYTWTALVSGTTADGTAFTTFLPALNSPGCFAGQCDWRLPTLLELQTILLAPYVCGTFPCIDSVFGPTISGYYWSSTTYAINPGDVWVVRFLNADVFHGFKNDSPFYARAVRGGL